MDSVAKEISDVNITALGMDLKAVYAFDKLIFYK
jgi:hypothetical protein